MQLLVEGIQILEPYPNTLPFNKGTIPHFISTSPLKVVSGMLGDVTSVKTILNAAQNPTTPSPPRDWLEYYLFWF